MSCGSTWTRRPVWTSRTSGGRRTRCTACSPNSAWTGIPRPPATGACTSTCGCSRAAAVALAREAERRRPDLVTAAWWKEERGQRVFIDFNQNAPHKTVFGAWSVRARPGAQVSTPLAWEEIDDIHPDQFTIASLPARLASVGDPWLGMNDEPQDLTPLLDLAARDQENGLPDAPWPPVYPKQPGELSRVAPSRARKPDPPVQE